MNFMFLPDRPPDPRTEHCPAWQSTLDLRRDNRQPASSTVPVTDSSLALVAVANAARAEACYRPRRGSNTPRPRVIWRRAFARTHLLRVSGCSEAGQECSPGREHRGAVVARFALVFPPSPSPMQSAWLRILSEPIDPSKPMCTTSIPESPQGEPHATNQYRSPQRSRRRDQRVRKHDPQLVEHDHTDPPRGAWWRSRCTATAHGSTAASTCR
jgi:hypothetical protein